jgi:diguanylate cyclase (GGDEF)-like protein
LHAQDVTASNQARLALEHQAHHDSLTGLPNRALLYERLREGIARSQTGSSQTALLVLDLDRFKDVNDTLGHSAGDVLLQLIAARLQTALRSPKGEVEPALGMAARLGGDEFAILLEDVDQNGATHVANVVLEALRAPLDLEGHLVSAEASIGIALCPGHGLDAETLFRRADVAMYAAKTARMGACVYSSDQDRHDPQRLEFVAELRTAIASDQLALHFQPQVNLRTGAMVGVEALVRWQHPRLGLVPPDDFIGLAEQTGLIRPLSQWVLSKALEAARSWRARGLHLPVAVNLSAWDLHDPNLVQRIGMLLSERGLAADVLRLEVTESSLMLDAERASATLSELRLMGVRSSVDDFGTGYSSLTQLKRLPVDELKIDRSFVRDMATDEEDRAIVRSTIGLAHSLGIHVVAEGVEDKETAQLLAELGCDWAQGYYFGRPLSEAELKPWLDRLVAAPTTVLRLRPPESFAA